jgi:hypothetical protein
MFALQVNSGIRWPKAFFLVGDGSIADKQALISLSKRLAFDASAASNFSAPRLKLEAGDWRGGH